MTQSRWGDPLPVSRRAFVAATTATVAAAGCTMSTDAPPPGVATLGELGPGTALSPGRIVAIHPVRYGAVPVVLETDDGRRFQVDVLARDPEVAGVAQTERLAVFVVNEGDGSTATDEAQGLSALAFGEALARQDRAGVQLPPLLTMSERTRRHPDAALAVPLA